MLELQEVCAQYGKSQVLQGVSVSVREGEIVALLGRNGAGKTTTLKTIMGLLPPTAGRISFAGQSLIGLKPHLVAQKGLALVPEHRGTFASLSVDENLRLAYRKASRWTIKDVFAIFPRLEERRATRAGKLSGGEQQMLSIARALVNRPTVLLLDEPTEGLAPVIVNELVELFLRLKASGIPILLVEQNLQVCLKVADRHTIIDMGRTVYTGDAAEFIQNQDVRDRYLALKEGA